MASPWSPVSLEEDEDEVEEVDGEDGEQVEEQQQQLVVSQSKKKVTPEASAKKQRKKRARSEVNESKSTNQSSSRKSKVWKDFQIVSPEGAPEIAECLHCSKRFSADTKNGTSSMLRHVKNKHPTARAEVTSYFLKTEKNDDGTDALKNYKVDLDYVRTTISMFLLGGAHPFTVVEEIGFRNMMGSACPQLKHVSRHTIRRDIMAMFESDRKELILSLSHSPGRVSFTSDNWKSDCQKYNYICITAHFIDEKWKLHKRIIWFKKLNPPLDGVSITDQVQLCFREWKVDSKVMCMTLDNASYNDKMITTLQTRLLSKGVLPLWGTFFQVRCCAHILNLVVQAGLKLIDASVDKLRDGIQYIKASYSRMVSFYENAVTLFQLEAKRKLHVDMPVRWNSTYKMIEIALYFQPALEHLSQSDSTYKSNFYPSFTEWERLRQMKKFLKTFYDATCIFSGTKYPTSNLYFKSVFMVHSRLIEAASEGESFMTPMVTEMKKKFDKYWNDYSTILSCAAVLDPRYKLELLSFCYGKLYGDDGKRRVEEVKSTMEELFKGYRGSVVYSSANQSSSKKSRNLDGEADMFSDYGKYISTRRTREEKSQLEAYLNDPVEDIEDNLDVLDYWNKASSRYPEVALMARDILAIPVSSVASESAFSSSRKIITHNQSSLTPKTIEALMCLQDWYREKMNAASAGRAKEEAEIATDEEECDEE